MAVLDFDNRLRVLIVDDMEEDRDALADILQMEGIQTDQAGSGEEARRLIEQSKGLYDVVLLDENLPDIQGINLLSEIRQGYPGVQIIMVTGQQNDSGPLALARGAFRYKIKPVHPREILLELRYISEERLGQKARILHKFSVESVEAASQIETLAEKILDWLGEIVPYQKAAVQLIQDDGTRKLLVHRGFGENGIDHHSVKPILQERLMNRAIQNKSPLVLSDPQADKDWLKEHSHTTNGSSDIRLWIGVPLMINDRAVGALTIVNTTQGPHPKIDNDLLNLFGEQAAVAMSSAAAQEEARRRIGEMEILNEVLRNISGQHQVKPLLTTIMYNIAQQLDCSQISIFLPYRENNEIILKPEVHFGLDKDTVDRLHFRIGEGIAGSVFQSGESRLISDTSKTPDFVVLNELDRQPRSILASPIKVFRRTIGVICVDQTKYGAFSKEEQRWLDALAQHAGMAIEHRRFLDGLNEISTLIMGAHSVTEVLTKIIAGAVKLTHTDSGAIYLLSKTEPQLEISQTVPYPTDFQPPIIRENGLTRYIVNSRETLLIKDTAQPNLPGHPGLTVNSDLVKRNVRSMVGIPLKTENEILGVFYINSAEIHDFSRPELAVLEALAGQAAIAIQQTRLKDSQIQTLRKIADQILSQAAQGSKDILQAIVDLTAKLMSGANLAQIRLYDEKSQEFFVEAVCLGPNVKVNARHKRLRKGKGVIGWVAEHRHSLIVPDVRNDPRYIAYVKGSGSELAVPMQKDDRVIGVLNIEHPRVNAFTEDDQRLAEAIASLAVIAMENLELITSKSERVDELERVLEIQDAFTSETNLAKFLHMALEKILHVTKATCGTVQLVSEDKRALVLTVEQNVPGIAVGDQVDVTDHVIGRDIKQTRSQNIDDVTRPEHAARYTPYSPTTRSALVVPMIAKSETIGVTIVESDKLDAFNSHTVRLAEALANQAALAISNALEREQASVAQDVAIQGIRRADWHHLIRQKAYSIDHYLKAINDALSAATFAQHDDSITVEEAINGITSVKEQLYDIEKIIKEDKKEAVVGDLKGIVSRVCSRRNDDIPATFHLSCEDVRLDIPAFTFELAVEKLIENALEAMRHQMRRTLDIAAQSDNQMVEITIRDSGPGIPPDVRPYFLKSRAPNASAGSGTGVLIARTIIERHGGRIIWADRNAPSGTTLLLRLPILKREKPGWL